MQASLIFRDVHVATFECTSSSSMLRCNKSSFSAASLHTRQAPEISLPQPGKANAAAAELRKCHILLPGKVHPHAHVFSKARYM